MAEISLAYIRLGGYAMPMEKSFHLFKALSEEVRLRILMLLVDGELCVCDLMAVLKLPQSTISRHLAYLKRAGWAEGERRGTWMYYRLPAGMSGLHAELLQVLTDHLLELPIFRQDRQALAARLKEKIQAACRTVE